MPAVECTNRAYPVSEPTQASGVSRRINKAREKGENVKLKDDQGRTFYLNPDHVIAVEE